MRAPRLALTIGMLGVLMAAPAASAAAPPTTIRIEIVFGVSEDFTTSGDVLCPSGTALTDPVYVAGFGSKGRGAGTFHLIKTLTCDDGSGTFQILVNAGSSPTSSGTVGGFAVIGGTGAYANLRGGGSLVGTYTNDGITDVYTGRLMNPG